MTSVTPVIIMKGFRARKDNVTLSSTTWDNPGIETSTNLAENTNWTQPVDTVFRFRTLLSDTVASTKTVNKTFGVEFNLASGGWTTVTASTAIQWSTSGNYADDDAITSAQITPYSTYTDFVEGDASEGDNAAPSAGNYVLGNATADYTVVEWALLIDSAQVSNGQTVQIRCTGVDSNTGETIPTVTISEGQTVTAVVLTRSPSLPQARLDHSLTAAVLTVTPSLPAAEVMETQQVDAVVLTATPTLPQAAVQMTSVDAVVLTATPSLPQAQLDHSITAQVLTITPTYPQASVSEAAAAAGAQGPLIWLWGMAAAAADTVTAVVLTATPSLPAARIDHETTAVVLTATPTMPQASVDHSLTAVVLEVTPTQPQAAVQMTSVGAVVLTATPSLPAASVDHSLTAVVLEVTPSLPQAQLDHSLTAVVLIATPAYPQARLDHELTAVVLTATPTLPAAAVSEAGAPQSITAIVLTATPSLPAASVDHSLTAVVLTVTPSYPQAALEHALTAQVLTATPSYPTASVDHSLTAQVLTATVSLPAARVDLDATAQVLTASVSLPAARIDHELTAVVLEVTPSYPQASVSEAGTPQSITAVVLTVTPTYPQARVDLEGAAVVLTATPSLPQARLDHTLTAVVLTASPSLPAADVRHNTDVRPSSDIALGGWTDELGGTTNIYLSIDEATANDADYVRSSTTPSTDIYRFHLGDPTDPECSGGHLLSYRYQKQSAGDTLSLTVRLLQGVSEIASWTHSDIAETVVEATQILTPTQTDAITDYSDLRVELEASQV